MENDKVTIRVAREDDAAALVAIYSPYVEQTAVTFDYEPWSEGRFREKIASTLERYPFLVAERMGSVVGYAYASPFVGRAAYQWSAETTVYVSMEERHTGVGSALYAALEQALLAMGVCGLEACIGYAPRADEHLSNDSPAFHEHLGFARVGRFEACGHKFGRWYDMVWMEKVIAPRPASPAPLRPFPQVRDEFERNLT